MPCVGGGPAEWAPPPRGGRTGLGEENMGGGGIGPISVTPIGGSGRLVVADAVDWTPPWPPPPLVVVDVVDSVDDAPADACGWLVTAMTGDR